MISYANVMVSLREFHGCVTQNYGNFKRRTEVVNIHELHGFYEFIGPRAKIENYLDKRQGVISITLSYNI